MGTSATLLTTGSIIISIAALLAVVLVLVTMSYRKRRMLAHEYEQELPAQDTTDGEETHGESATP